MTELSSTSAAPEPTPFPTEQVRVELMRAAGVPEEYFDHMGPHGVSPLSQKLGMIYRELSPEKAVATIPVSGNEQNVGLLHGGAHFVMAETLASVSAILHVRVSLGQLNRNVVGVELGATHHRSVTSGLVWATCTPIKLGRTMTSHEIVMRDDEGRRLSTARMSNMILDPVE